MTTALIALAFLALVALVLIVCARVNANTTRHEREHERRHMLATRYATSAPSVR